MSSDPSLLEDRTRASHMALRFGWVAAKGTGGRAPFMEHSIAWECSSYRLEHLFLWGGITFFLKIILENIFLENDCLRKFIFLEN